MTKRNSLVGELIAERRIEEFHENIQDAFQVMSDEPKFRRVAAHVYISLAGLWGLSKSETAILLDISVKEFEAWKLGDFRNLPADQLEKISCLLGIYKDLGTLYSGHMDRVGAWLLRPNLGELYGGKTPCDLLARAHTRVFHLVRQNVAGATV